MGHFIFGRIALVFGLFLIALIGVAWQASAWQEEFGGSKELEYPYYRSPAWIPAGDFARNDEIANAKLSPDGSHMIAAFPMANFIQVRVASILPEEFEGHFFFNTAFGDLENVHWADNENIVVQTRQWHFDPKVGFYPRIVLRVFRRDQQATRYIRVFDVRKPEAMVGDMVLHMLPDDPRRILIAASLDGKSYPAVYKLDFVSGDLELVEAAQKNITTWKTDTKGNVRLGYGAVDDELKIIAKATATSNWAELQNNELFKDGRFFPVMFDFDDTTMVVRSAVANGRFAYYRFNLTTGGIEEKIFEHPSVDVEDIEFSTAKRKLQAVTYIEDTHKRHFLDEDFRKLFEAIDMALPERSNYLLSRSADERYLLIKSVSDRYPGAIYRLDMLTKELNVVSELNNSLNPRLLSPVERVNYYARDGLEIPAYITRPITAQAGPLPAVVLPHGGPYDRDVGEYDRMAQFLASRGYLVLQPNFRGSVGYTFEYQMLGFGQWGGAIQEDIEDAAKYLVAEGLANPDGVCIVGQSTFASYSALLAVLKTPELFSCSVAVAPIPDIRSHAKTMRYWYGRGTERSITGGRGSKELKAASPVELADTLKKPLLMFYGGRDWLINPKDIVALEKQLKKSGGNFQFLSNAKEGHGLTLPGVRGGFYKKLEEFLAEHLGQPDQSHFVLERNWDKGEKRTAAVAQARAKKLDLDEVMERCIPAHFEPFVTVSKHLIPDRIGYCTSYLKEAGTDAGPQVRLSAYLTRAKLNFLADDKQAFARDLASARQIVAEAGKGNIELASRLALEILDILKQEQDGDEDAAYARARAFADAYPNLHAAQDLLTRMADDRDDWDGFNAGLRGKLRLSPDARRYEDYLEGLMRTRRFADAKTAIVGAAALGQNVRNMGTMLLSYAQAEIALGNLESAGRILMLLNSGADNTPASPVPLPGYPGFDLAQFADRLYDANKDQVRQTTALYYFEAGQPDKAREYVPGDVDDCYVVLCWQLNRHFALLAGNDVEAKSLQKLVDKANPNPYAGGSRDWRQQLVRRLPAVPIAVLRGERADPNLQRHMETTDTAILFFFDAQSATDDYSFWKSVQRQVADEVRRRGATAYRLLDADCGVGSPSYVYRVADTNSSVPHYCKVEALIIDPDGMPMTPAPVHWMQWSQADGAN